MSSEFFFSLLRITTAQIFRAAGIDRCNPSVLDTATDIAMRHLLLLADTCVDLAAGSGRSEVNIQDLAEAMVSIGLIRPCREIDTSCADDEFDLDKEYDSEDAMGDELETTNNNHNNNNGPRITLPPGQDVTGFIQFIEWAKGRIPNDARVISRVVVPQAPSLAATTTATTATALPALFGAGSTEIPPTTATTTAVPTDPQAATQLPQPPTSTTATAPAAIVTEEWLTSLMKKQVKVGHEKRFHGTLLAEDDSMIPISSTTTAPNVPPTTGTTGGDPDAIATAAAAASEFKIMGGPASLEEAFQHIMASSSHTLHQTASPSSF